MGRLKSAHTRASASRPICEKMGRGFGGEEKKESERCVGVHHPSGESLEFKFFLLFLLSPFEKRLVLTTTTTTTATTTKFILFCGLR